MSSHEIRSNEFLPLEVNEYTWHSECSSGITMDELAEDLQLSFPLITDQCFSPCQFLHEEISVETEDENRRRQKRTKQGENGQKEKRRRHC